MRETYPKLKFNMLRVYFGKPYVIDLENAEGSITVRDPGMRAAFIDCDETDFWGTVRIFTSNTTQFRVFLDDIGLDWNDVTDFQLFQILYKQADPEICKLLFGEDIDLQGFELFEKRDKESDETTLVLYNTKTQTEINEDVYQHIHQYLCTMFHMFPEDELTNDKTLKKWWIDKDKREAARNAKKPKEEFSIQPLISACVNHPGFKYKLREIEDMGITEFYDSVNRLQLYESCTALMKGMYSGMIDSKSIKAEDYNWMKSFDIKT